MILKFLKFLCLILLLNSNFNNLFSQNLYYQNNSINIYTFLDDLANKEVINFNTSVKPYDNYLIAELLTVANEKREFLNKVEKRKLDFYLNEFNFYNQSKAVCKYNLKKRYETLFKITKTRNIQELDHYFINFKKKLKLEQNFNKLGINLKRDSKKIFSKVNDQRLKNNPIQLLKTDISLIFEKY